MKSYVDLTEKDRAAQDYSKLEQLGPLAYGRDGGDYVWLRELGVLRIPVDVPDSPDWLLAP